MNSIGETLRRERQKRNLDLERIARETKINIRLLQAIESEDFAKLPGGVFTKSFVRQYARLLGLDEDEIAAELQRSLGPAVPETEEGRQPAPEPAAIELPRLPDWAAASSPRSRSALPALALVVVVMLVCSGVYAWWQRSKHPAPVAQREPQVTMQPAAAPPVTPAPAPEAQPKPETGATAERESAPAAAAPANPAATVHVQISAAEPTWVSARAGGKMLYSGTLEANQQKALDAESPIRLVVGNAGGLAITLNGKILPPLGPKGQVRVVQLSSGGVTTELRKPAAEPGP